MTGSPLQISGETLEALGFPDPMKVRRINLDGLILDVIAAKWDAPMNMLLIYDYEIVRFSEEMDTRDMIEEATRHFNRHRERK